MSSNTKVDLSTLDEFVRHYITAARWSSVDDEGTSLDDPEFDVAADTEATMRADCRSWISANADLLSELSAVAEECGYGSHPDCGTIAPVAAACAHDLWLARNGHGSGFWDRNLGELGERLATAAGKAGMRDLYVSGGMICQG